MPSKVQDMMGNIENLTDLCQTLGDSYGRPEKLIAETLESVVNFASAKPLNALLFNSTRC